MALREALASMCGPSDMDVQRSMSGIGNSLGPRVPLSAGRSTSLHDSLRSLGSMGVPLEQRSSTMAALPPGLTASNFFSSVMPMNRSNSLYGIGNSPMSNGHRPPVSMRSDSDSRHWHNKLVKLHKSLGALSLVT
jgi:hypothetical protein